MAQTKQFGVGYAAAAALDGTEQLSVVQAGVTVDTTTQAIADLAGGAATAAIQFACSDLSTNITTGVSKAALRAPYALNVTSVRASLFVAQAAGSIFTVNVKVNGATILSTKITIDNTEKTSVTAATQPVLTSTPYALADDAEITVDVDQVGTPLAKGLVVTLLGTPP